MKKYISIIIALLLTLSVTGCGKSAEPVENVQPSVSVETKKPQDIQPKEIFNTPKVSSGILAAFAGDQDKESKTYRTISLVWVDPNTGDTNIYRTFTAPDSTIVLDPEKNITKTQSEIHFFAGPVRSGKRYLSQSFDSDYSRIVAKNTETGSYGWVDTNGDYTDVTGNLFSDGEVHHDTVGLGFYDGYYYLSTATCPMNLYNNLTTNRNEAMRETTTTIYRIPIDFIDPSQLEEIPVFDHHITELLGISGYKESRIYGTPGELDDADKHYLIHSDADEIYAFGYPVTAGTGFYSPLFYDDIGIGGYCASAEECDDWISSSETICSSDTQIYIVDTITYDLDQTKHKDRHYIVECIKSDPSKTYYDYEYDNVVLNPQKTEFSCMEIHSVPDIFPQYYTYIAIYDLDGNKLHTLNNTKNDELNTFSLNVNGCDLELMKILDWINN